MLKIKELSKTYDNGVHALNNVSLDIPKGMYGLLGPNGAGKSSLMRTISTLQSADSGSITFDGIDVLDDPQSLRQRLGYLPQDFGVYPRISAYDLLDHMAILKGISNKALYDWGEGARKKRIFDHTDRGLEKNGYRPKLGERSKTKYEYKQMREIVRELKYQKNQIFIEKLNNQPK